MIFVSRWLAGELERFCQKPPNDCGRGEVIYDEEVRFENGNRMAIQVIASEQPSREPCWTQGVLFDHKGHELGCTSVGDSFLGEYCVFDAHDKYVVIVQEQDRS